MRTRIVGLIAVSLATGVFLTESAAGEKDKGEQKAETGATQGVEKASDKKELPLTAVEKAKKAAEEAAARAAAEALRKKVAANIESIVGRLDVGRARQARVKALTTESQWKLAVSAFKTTRGEEIHDHAHKIVPKTIPGLMQKFMPGYMRSKIMASRRKGRRGPPSRAEIAQIQKDARTKIEPQMRKTVMPALDKLMQERVAELHKDEKVMTRVIADRIIKVNLLGTDGAKQFSVALDKAGYPTTLTIGEDEVLNERTVKLLNALDLKEIVKAAGL
ncbi:MAG: hypothetical protein VB858_19800 [Planctomycetaceae bacterium]|jgi:hypothetical protein